MNKNEDFFLNNKELFSALDSKKVLHLKRLWQSEKLDDDDKEVIWKWFQSFVNICKKYRNSLS